MPCSDDDRLVYSIKELPEVFSVEPIDLFVVETLNGTSIVSFDNIVFDLNQTTFEETFNKHTTDIDALSTSLNNTVTREIPSFEFRQAANISGSTNLNGVLTYDNVSFNIGGAADNTTGEFISPVDGIYTFNFACTFKNGEVDSDDTVQVGFKITNNDTYYNDLVTGEEGLRINPKRDTAAEREVSYSFSKTIRLQQSAVVSVNFFGHGSDTPVILTYAEFSGHQIL